MTDREGGCLCGAVRYAITTDAIAGADEPPGLTYCHCSMCRKATGGPYAALISVPREALRWTFGAPKLFRSSPIASRGFCAACGSPLTYDADAEDKLEITVGSLDDASSVRPKLHYGIESRLPWVHCGADLPGMETKERFDGQPAE